MRQLPYLALLLCSSAFAASPVVVNDFSRTNPVEVSRVIRVNSEADIRRAYDMARTQNRKISFASKRFSQGGHTAFNDGVVADFSGFNRVVKLDTAARQITVQGGITWAEIQQHINPHGLAVKVMQSSNVFSVGGSISANIHGRDPNYGTIAETIVSMKLMLADGSIVIASRNNRPELFYSVIGGFGSIAAIVEVTLSLTDNTRLEKRVQRVDYSGYVDSLENSLRDDTLQLHYGRCSFVPNKTLLKDCIVANYFRISDTPVTDALLPEKHVRRDRFFFNLSRKYTWGKRLRWRLQNRLIDNPGKPVQLSRNNAMRPPISFLEYRKKGRADILQEYFLPPDQFVPFMDALRDTVVQQEINLLSMTLRYIRPSEPVSLNYAGSKAIAVVLYINIDLDDDGIAKARNWTRTLVQSATELGGTYYLTYQRFPGVDQFRRAYPAWETFRQDKRRFDPGALIMNQFYDQYLATPSN